MKNLLLTVILLFSFVFITCAQNVRKVATWNMKWLGVNSGRQVDAIENVRLYADYILETGATLFALQEIGATHSVAGQPRFFYLDQIIDTLNKSIQNASDQWTYILDSMNTSQRLAFLYRKDLWELSDSRSINPGSSFQHIRKPFIVTVHSKGTDAQLMFDFICIHLKAFPDATEQRTHNFEELSTWLQTDTLDSDVLIAGDTNIYTGETDVYQSIKDIGYKYLFDAEKTAIHEGALGQRFDRFFSSPDLLNKLNSALDVTDSIDFIDVIKDNDPDKILWFDQNLSDHYAVVLNIDVSEER